MGLNIRNILIVIFFISLLKINNPHLDSGLKNYYYLQDLYLESNILYKKYKKITQKEILYDFKTYGDSNCEKVLFFPDTRFHLFNENIFEEKCVFIYVLDYYNNEDFIYYKGQFKNKKYDHLRGLPVYFSGDGFFYAQEFID